MEKRFRHDRDLSNWMDERREKSINIINSILKEINHPPLQTMENSRGKCNF